MGLLSSIRDAKPVITLEDAAKKLADSRCNLRSADMVTDYLIGMGIRPWMIKPDEHGYVADTMDIWIAAHNLRTLRAVGGKAYPLPRTEKLGGVND